MGGNKGRKKIRNGRFTGRIIKCRWSSWSFDKEMSMLIKNQRLDYLLTIKSHSRKSDFIQEIELNGISSLWILPGISLDLLTPWNSLLILRITSESKINLVRDASSIFTTIDPRVESIWPSHPILIRLKLWESLSCWLTEISLDAEEISRCTQGLISGSSSQPLYSSVTLTLPTVVKNSHGWISSVNRGSLVIVLLLILDVHRKRFIGFHLHLLASLVAAPRSLSVGEFSPTRCALWVITSGADGLGASCQEVVNLKCNEIERAGSGGGSVCF